MFTLIGLGVGVAYLYSLVAALFPGIFPASFLGESGEVAVYFEAAAVIVTLGLLGEGPGWGGEPIPVEKRPGDRVTGATVNGTGGLVMRAERVGSETLLARIVQMGPGGQRSRAPLQKLAATGAGAF